MSSQSQVQLSPLHLELAALAAQPRYNYLPRAAGLSIFEPGAAVAASPAAADATRTVALLVVTESDANFSLHVLRDGASAAAAADAPPPRELALTPLFRDEWRNSPDTKIVVEIFCKFWVNASHPIRKWNMNIFTKFRCFKF